MSALETQTRIGAGKRKRDSEGWVSDAAHPAETRSPRARLSCLDGGAEDDGAGEDGCYKDADGRHPPPPLMTEEELDIQQHKQITAQRNFDKVNFGKWQIKTWYFSPYPLTESEVEDSMRDATGSPGPSALPSVPRGRGRPPGSASGRPPKIPGVQRTTLRSHGRTSDLFAGGLTRSHLTGDKSVLWVCERCFKYMSEGSVWEMHACDRRHPPGRKVYQRGAHTIWEVDGAIEKLYCQNLSLFGKFFIDVKTLFFDCDNFLFYILTDADSQRDHVLGFFSKEKYSYDDYNLACIIVLPPYQRKGYGMLMIEFSYELSRRSGKVGTPERPLSELGLRSYLTYWVATVVRFLRRLLSVLPPDCDKVTAEGWVSTPLPPSQTQTPAEVSHAHTPSLPPSQSHSQTQFLPTSQPPTHLPVTEDTPTPGLSTPTAKKKRGPKGWDGEIVPSPHSLATPADGNAYDIFTPLRKIITVPNVRDGSATSHVVVHCTLADIARATNLRIEDVAFAMCECGLLERVQEARRGGGTAVLDGTNATGITVTEDAAREQESDEHMVVGITREMVETVVKERRVKEMCLSLAHVLL